MTTKGKARPIDSGRKDSQGRRVMVAEGATETRADAPAPPSVADRQSALNRKLARLNKMKMVLAIDSALPAGVARCVDCGRFASESDPSHTCPVPGMIAEGMPRQLARDLAQAGFESKQERHVWAAAIDEMGVAEAGAFKALGLSPVDAKRAARQGQSGVEMLRELVEAEEAADNTADDAEGVERAPDEGWQAKGAKRAKKVSRVDGFNPAGYNALWKEARETAPDGVGFEMAPADLRSFMADTRKATWRGAFDEGRGLVVIADGHGNIALSDYIGQSGRTLHGAGGDAGGPWMAVIPADTVKKALDGAGRGGRLNFSFAGGKVSVNDQTADMISNGETAAKAFVPTGKITRTEFDDTKATDFGEVAKFCSNDYGRQVLHRVQVEKGENGGLVMVATNSYIMRVRADESEIPADGNWAAAKAETAMQLPSEVAQLGVAAVQSGKAGMLVETATGTRVNVEAPPVDYPQWRRLIPLPDDRKPQVTIPNVKGLREAMKKVTPDAVPIRVAQDSAGRVRLYGRTAEGGEQTAYQDKGFDSSTEQFRVAFNPDYLAAAMDGYDGDFTFESDPMRPNVARHPRGADLLMPVRVPS